MEQQSGPRPRFRVTLLDAAIALLHLYRAKEDPEVGFLDGENRFEYIVKKLEQQHIMLRKDVLESALYSANMLDERGKFTTPDGRSFKQWIRGVIKETGYSRGKLKFDQTYNTLTLKDEE